MWLDFNANCALDSETAVLVSVQGVNPLDGQKASPDLSRYEVCPIHGPLRADRLCTQCGHEWPAQNFLSSRATPCGLFWLDGFRAADGQTRQFVFTAEEMRGIAAQVIGSERTFSVGLAFFKGPQRPRPSYEMTWSPYFPMVKHEVHYDVVSNPHISISVSNPNDETLYSSCVSDQKRESYFALSLDEGPASMSARSMRALSAAPKQLEIAAGERIKQDVYACDLPLDSWSTTPDAIIYINYAPHDVVAAIVKSGKPDASRGSFLSRLNVGN